MQQHYREGHDISLLQSVAEQLRAPLTIIAKQAELIHIDPSPSMAEANIIRTQASAALTLVDNYLLGIQLLTQQSQLQLEPVSASSTITEAAHALSSFANQYGIKLNVSIAGKYEPVMAHKQALGAALVSLGFTLIEAISTLAIKQDQKVLQLAVHRGKGGIIAGAYGPLAVKAQEWHIAQKTRGTSHQAFTSLLGTAGAGIFVADALCQAMQTNIIVGRYARQSGMAMSLAPSHQLQLI